MCFDETHKSEEVSSGSSFPCNFFHGGQFQYAFSHRGHLASHMKEFFGTQYKRSGCWTWNLQQCMATAVSTMTKNVSYIRKSLGTSFWGLLCYDFLSHSFSGQLLELEMKMDY